MRELSPRAFDELALGHCGRLFDAFTGIRRAVGVCDDNAVLAALKTAQGTGSRSAGPTAEIVVDADADVC